MEKIKKLKKFFKENLDGYLIPKNDEFFGEYVSEYNDRLKLYFKFYRILWFFFNTQK